MEHAKLSASGSSRWLACPGSIRLDNPDAVKENNGAAMEGSAVHAISEKAMQLFDDATVFIGSTVESIEITREMALYANEYIDYLRAYSKSHFKMGIEKRVDFSKYVPDGFGTCDAYIIDSDNKICHVMDLKYGMIEVEAEDNSQLQLYALGLHNEFKLKDYTFMLHIIQPRVKCVEYIEPFQLSESELLDFGRYVIERAGLTELSNAPRIPGEKQCRYCPNNATCIELSKYIEQTIGCEFENIDEDKLDKDNIVAKLDNAKLSNILKAKDLILNFIKNVEYHMQTEAMTGVKFDGFKLVEAKTNRRFTDKAESVLFEKLGDSCYTKKLIGVTDAEKLIKDKKIIDEITFKPKGSPTLVKSTDRRKEISFDDAEFENINNVEE